MWFLSFCRFYTLMVLSTALFGKPAFKNLICNGLVLAEDGKKMSKSLRNYPSPMEVINDYGAVSEFFCIWFDYSQKIKRLISFLPKLFYFFFYLFYFNMKIKVCNCWIECLSYWKLDKIFFSVQDAVRLYLINSPVVRAETLRFKKDGVYCVVSVSSYCWVLYF